jgi:hypothetical protein
VRRSWHVRCSVTGDADGKNGVRNIEVDLEAKVARCRLILSAVAIVAVYIDPTEPALLPWLNLTGGGFNIDWRALTVMGAHFAYSVVVYVVLVRTLPGRDRIVTITTWADVLFGTVITVFTEGTSSPREPGEMGARVATGPPQRRSMNVRSTFAGLSRLRAHGGEPLPRVVGVAALLAALARLLGRGERRAHRRGRVGLEPTAGSSRNSWRSGMGSRFSRRTAPRQRRHAGRPPRRARRYDPDKR